MGDFENAGNVATVTFQEPTKNKRLAIIIIAMAAALLVISTALAYYQLIGFVLEKSQSMGFIHDLRMGSVENMLVSKFGALSVVTGASILMRDCFGKIVGNWELYVPFAGVIIFGFVLAVSVFYRLFHDKSRWVRATVIPASFLSGAILVFAIVTGLFTGVSSRAMGNAKKTIGDIFAELNKSLSSEDGIIIGGAQNIVLSIKNGHAKLEKIESGVTKEKMFYAYAKETLPEHFPLGQSVYVPYLIKNDPDILPDIDTNVVLFPDGMLAAGNFSGDDVRILMPVIAPDIIRKRFADFKIGFEEGKEADFSVLPEDSYNQYQTKKGEELKEDLKDFIVIINNYINQADRVIANNNSVISSASATQEQLSRDKKKYVNELQDTYDKYCKGSYSGVSECKELKKQIEENKKIIAAAQNEISQYKSQAQAANAEAIAVRREASQYLGDIKTALLSIENNPIIPEYQLGLFSSSDNAIYLKYSPDYSFGEYLSTGVHEYAHALTHNDKNEWPYTLEESMTEYVMATSIVSLLKNEEDAKKLSIGYVDEVMVLTAMFDVFGKDKLTELYFTDKSWDSLEKLLKEKFTDKKDLDLFEKQLEALFYIPLADRENRDKAVKSLTEMLKPEQAGSQ